MDTKTLTARRAELRETVKDGAILLVGQDEAARNYTANPYAFRQDSHFLYYVGTNLPSLSALILPDGTEQLFGPPEDPDDLIWSGPHPVLADHAESAGMAQTADNGALKPLLDELKSKGVSIHYLPPYRAERTIKLAELLSLPYQEVVGGASQPLARAIVEQRSIKTEAEAAEIDEALTVTKAMYEAAVAATRPGALESTAAGALQGAALAHDRAQSFLPIVSVRGEVLHNTYCGNTMQVGDLLVIDSGAESKNFYASDITRTYPVTGKFDQRQKAIYQIVLDSQLAAIGLASPEVPNRDLHFAAATTIAAGLKDLGLMKGDTEQAVKAGAHALFFPHGIGHMIGLDVHDMEDLGDVVGYPAGEPRSVQFGLSFLRLAKKLKAGFCITVEPGVYFVPALIERWKAERVHEAFVDYAEVDKYVGLGGVRIEDDVLITTAGHKVLGPGIPKTVADIEEMMSS
ncbi:MAG: aminopeptidase P N-terminal domain-containing protein [Deltaproteobacteria bacterium]|nr:aminopeptidase P N-terminal domain-containing protein [Deltaproteobacteria bacterium]